MKDGKPGAGVAAALSDRSHRRRNALTGEWVLVSPHRTQRPWLGQKEAPAVRASVQHDPECYLCPGNARANGAHNPSYSGPFVFENDFSALTASTDTLAAGNELFTADALHGVCRVICYSPRHDLSFGELSFDAATDVVRAWRAQFLELDARKDLAYTLIFENRGEMMGASNPHPHGQIWSTSKLPNEVERELQQQSAYLAQQGRPLLIDYVEAEIKDGARIVQANDHWVALVPFWAVWPFELLIAPRRRVGSFADLVAGEEAALAGLLRSVVAIYDRVFEAPFPYSMGWHPRPSDGAAHEGWVLHGHFFPPLLRSASVRKFQVGFEMLGMPQRDLTPEAAAERLRAVAKG